VQSAGWALLSVDLASGTSILSAHQICNVMNRYGRAPAASGVAGQGAAGFASLHGLSSLFWREKSDEQGMHGKQLKWHPRKLVLMYSKVKQMYIRSYA
jgi:hypothetical protein